MTDVRDRLGDKVDTVEGRTQPVADADTQAEKAAGSAVGRTSPGGHLAPATDQRAGRQPPTLRVPLTSLGEMIRVVYSTKRKRILPSKREVRAMSAVPTEEWERLLKVAEHDQTLERTTELLLLTFERVMTPSLAAHLRRFGRDVMRRHRAFASPLASAVLDGRSDQVADTQVIELIVTEPYTVTTPSEGDAANSLRPVSIDTKALQQTRTNALSCLLLWMKGMQQLTLEAFQRHLYAHAWKPAARRHVMEAARLRALIATRDPTALAVVCSTHETRIQEQTRLLTAATRASEQAKAQVTHLEEDLAERSLQLEGAKTDRENLTAALRAAELAYQDAVAQFRDRMETLRGRVLGRLREEVSLLQDGLHALRRDPPKVHVMADHAERAIDALTREVGRLEQEDDNSR